MQYGAGQLCLPWHSLRSLIGSRVRCYLLLAVEKMQPYQLSTISLIVPLIALLEGLLCRRADTADDGDCSDRSAGSVRQCCARKQEKSLRATIC